MAIDEAFVERIRASFAGRPDVEEKRMFGGLAFMVDGHMCCGPLGPDLMVRVGPEAYEDALALPGARVMDFTGRPMKGFITVGADAIASDAALRAWIDRGLAFVESLPPKKKK